MVGAAVGITWRVVTSANTLGARSGFNRMYPRIGSSNCNPSESVTCTAYCTASTTR